jgi:hypothetical protein
VVGGRTDPVSVRRRQPICQINKESGTKPTVVGGLFGNGGRTLVRIRLIEIRHFRCIREFTWWPSPGINCMMGPGDVSKSSILDAIDLCLGARRNVQFTDADFYNLNVEKPIPRHFASMVDATTS